MRTAFRVLFLAVASIVATVSAQAPAPQVPPPAPVRAEPPRLVVLLVVDQMRADYVDLYGSQWTQGLRRLLDSGAYFPLAAYPYAVTKTCAGHVSIGTGAVPATHGMIDNTWYDRATRRLTTCTEDPAAVSVAFAGGTGTEHHSPHLLTVPTFADELRLQARRLPRILSVSLKPRSAIGMVGHPGDGTIVVWEEDNGTWATSSAFTATPWPEVNEYIKAHPLAAAYGQSWIRLFPPARYLFQDDVPGEATPRVFPHLLTSPSGKPDNTFVTAWERSPLPDAYVADLASHLSTQFGLGRQQGTDMLAVSFTALDTVGHAYGPRSHEVQDVLGRLDVAIGKLLNVLDRVVGRNYVVALTADHGVAPIPEQAVSLGIDAGRISSDELQQALQGELSRLFGRGSYVVSINSPYVYFAPGVIDRITADPRAMNAVAAAATSVKGVWRVYWSTDIGSRVPTDDALLRSLRLSYFPGRSGDMAFVPRPFWMLQVTGTTHGTPFDYDRRVPLALAGAGIKPGRYYTTASPIDIAPTLAFLTGITLSHVDGRVLTEAVGR